MRVKLSSTGWRINSLKMSRIWAASSIESLLSSAVSRMARR
jgi:hypothetical protein